MLQRLLSSAIGSVIFALGVSPTASFAQGESMHGDQSGDREIIDILLDGGDWTWGSAGNCNRYRITFTDIGEQWSGSYFEMRFDESYGSWVPAGAVEEGNRFYLDEFLNLSFVDIRDQQTGLNTFSHEHSIASFSQNAINIGHTEEDKRTLVNCPAL